MTMARVAIMVPMAYIPDPERDQIAIAQLAVDAQVKEREFAYPVLHLEADAQRPDVFQVEGRFWPNDLALVQRTAFSGVACVSHDGLSSS